MEPMKQKFTSILVDPVLYELVQPTQNTATVIGVSIPDEQKQISSSADFEYSSTDETDEDFYEDEQTVCAYEPQDMATKNILDASACHCFVQREVVGRPNEYFRTFQYTSKLTFAFNKNVHSIEETMSNIAKNYSSGTSSSRIKNSKDILSWIGPCPLYSFGSSYGLDMHHGLSNFPCRDLHFYSEDCLENELLWKHLTNHHNMNINSASRIIRRLVSDGYKSETENLFGNVASTCVLRTTQRFSLAKSCPLTYYGAYGVYFEHGARLCSGVTLNKNIYLHLLSFHRMTNRAALRLSRAVALRDQHFRFKRNETIVKFHFQNSESKLVQAETLFISKTDSLEHPQVEKNGSSFDETVRNMSD